MAPGSAVEITRDALTLDLLLGSGSFGEVFK